MTPFEKATFFAFWTALDLVVMYAVYNWQDVKETFRYLFTNLHQSSPDTPDEVQHASNELTLEIIEETYQKITQRDKDENIKEFIEEEGARQQEAIDALFYNVPDERPTPNNFGTAVTDLRSYIDNHVAGDAIEGKKKRGRPKGSKSKRKNTS